MIQRGCLQNALVGIDQKCDLFQPGEEKGMQKYNFKNIIVVRKTLSTFYL